MDTTLFFARRLTLVVASLVMGVGCGGDDDGSAADGGPMSADGGVVDMDGGASTDAGADTDAGEGADGGTASDAGVDPVIVERIRMTCQHAADCASLSGSIDGCVTNTTDTYADIIAVCPGDMATLLAYLDCYIAAMCPADMDSVCLAERAAVDEARTRCLGS